MGDYIAIQSPSIGAEVSRTTHTIFDRILRKEEVEKVDFLQQHLWLLLLSHYF